MIVESYYEEVGLVCCTNGSERSNQTSKDTTARSLKAPGEAL